MWEVDVVLTALSLSPRSITVICCCTLTMFPPFQCAGGWNICRAILAGVRPLVPLHLQRGHQLGRTSPPHFIPHSGTFLGHFYCQNRLWLTVQDNETSLCFWRNGDDPMSDCTRILEASSCVKFTTDSVTLFGSTTTLPTERFFIMVTYGTFDSCCKGRCDSF